MAESTPQSDKARVSNPQLAVAVSDAQQLLAFAARNGIKLDADLIRIVVKAGAAPAMLEEDEAVFWEKFSRLAAAVAPVSAESIRTMSAPGAEPGLAWWECWKFWKWWGRGRPDAQKTVHTYTAVAFCALFILIIVQTYWAVGSLLVSDIQQKKTQIKEIEIKLLASREISTKSSSGLFEEDRDFWMRQQSASVDKQLKTDKENLEIYQETNYQWLERWNNVAGFAWWTEDVGGAEADPEAFMKENVSSLQTATVLLDILQRYLLPLVYGFLGTCVFILRDLSSKIRFHAFTRASTINFHIRLCLGTLGGLAVVWFVTPEKAAEPFLSLSPLALAFLAGYSVELLFAAMDTMINAFTGRKDTTAKEGKGS